MSYDKSNPVGDSDEVKKYNQITDEEGDKGVLVFGVEVGTGKARTLLIGKNGMLQIASPNIERALSQILEQLQTMNDYLRIIIDEE